MGEGAGQAHHVVCGEAGADNADLLTGDEDAVVEKATVVEVFLNEGKRGALPEGVLPNVSRNRVEEGRAGVGLQVLVSGELFR